MRAEGQNHLSCPAGHTALDIIGFLGCRVHIDGSYGACHPAAPPSPSQEGCSCPSSHIYPIIVILPTVILTVGDAAGGNEQTGYCSIVARRAEALRVVL